MTIQVAEISALLWGSGSDDISSIIVIQNCGELRRAEDIYFDVKWWLVSLQSGVTSLPREYLSSREKVLRWRFSWLRILIRMGGIGRRRETKKCWEKWVYDDTCHISLWQCFCSPHTIISSTMNLWFQQSNINRWHFNIWNQQFEGMCNFR